MRKRDYLVPFLSILAACSPRMPEKSNIPDLRAEKDDALYTTYVAARERSSFVLDEGYEFVFYHDSLGIGFNTDTAGELGFGFLVNGRWVYATGEFFQKPVIHASFPDQVFFSFAPVQGLEAKGNFWVYSSRSAVLELELKNVSDTAMEFDWAPFVKAGHRMFREASLDEGRLHFVHEEYPDTWTTSHKLPYADSLENLFAMNDEPAKAGFFTSFAGESNYPPWMIYPLKRPVKEVNGRIYDGEGQRLMKMPPQVRLQAYLDEDKKYLLTESSPVLGSMQGTLNADGYFRMELSHLPGFEQAMSFTLSAADAHGGFVAQVTDILPASANQFRRDLRLQPARLSQPPGNFRVKMQGKQRAALSWTRPVDGSRIVIYRKAEGEAFFTQFSSPLDGNSLMVQLPDDRLYSFIAVGIAATGDIGMHSREVTTLGGNSLTSSLGGEWKQTQAPYFSTAAMSRHIRLEAGETERVRVVRAVRERGAGSSWEEASLLLKDNFALADGGRTAYLASLPFPGRLSKDDSLLVLSGWNMMQQVFYPPEGKSSYPYYVFSREPVWGWGHGGQVFHESLTMLALALQDPELAMSSQRVFSERQYENGYINYRTGSYLDEIIEHEGELTSSAPWYAWISWEVYRISRDKAFLLEMYESGKRFYEFYTSRRDKDGDGLCEWGGHAVLESVRDAAVAVWDEVAWPAELEAVDLNAMLVMEAKSLEAMAKELGKEAEASQWKADYEQRSRLINSTFWDEETGFYYQADGKDNDFTYARPDDLKRMEIIGFLPLWAGIASKEQAERLVQHLTNTEKFWRPYGVPSLAADDTFYNGKGYWNGPVWVEWNYLVLRGLLEYGYRKEAEELVKRVKTGMIYQLKENHNLWEFYSPDTPWAGYHRTYIWAGIVNRMLWDVRQ